jgi:hypothetical protein
VRLLTGTSDLVQVVTGSAGAIAVHTSFMEVNTSTIAVSGILRTNTPSITGATTTTVVASPASGFARNVKGMSIFNTHATVSNAIQVNHTDGTNVAPQWSGTLLAGEYVELDEVGWWCKYSASGILQSIGLPVTTKGDLLTFDTVPNRLPIGADGLALFAASSATQGMKWAAPYRTNRSVITVSAGYAADTYLAGSSITMPAGGPVVGTAYHCVFDMVKTAAGTAAFTVTVRFGTAGTTSDAALLTFAFTAGSAVADTGRLELFLHFRTVGSGTAAVVVGQISCDHQFAATGLTTQGAAGFAQITTVSSGFDSTPAGSILGLSVNGGASFSGTNTIVEAEALNSII